MKKETSDKIELEILLNSLKLSLPSTRELAYPKDSHFSDRFIAEQKKIYEELLSDIDDVEIKLNELTCIL